MLTSTHRVNNLSYIVVDNFYTEIELSKIKKEVLDLERFKSEPEKTSTALDKEGGVPVKTGTVVFLDSAYLNNRDKSDILNSHKKIYSSEFVDEVKEFDVIFTWLNHSNFDNTLINYYSSGQEYKPHRDGARMSTVTFLRFGEFTGGDFIFPEQNVVIECVENRTVIFPSVAVHSATPIYGDGQRVSIAAFIDYLNDR